MALIQESYSMLNFVSNSLAFVLKRFRLLYGHDKDSHSKVCMFVQSHAQTFLLSSTLLYHITCFKYDLCRVCSEFLKSVEWICYNVPIKSIKSTYIIRAFLDILSIITPKIFNSSFSKSYLVHGDHCMFNWQLKCTSDVSNYTTKVFFVWLYLIKTSFANVCIHHMHVGDHARHILRALSWILDIYFSDSVMLRCDWYCLKS